jgi:hypothetical protein
MGRKSVMAYPTPQHHIPVAGQAPAPLGGTKPGFSTPRCQSPDRGSAEGEHQLEKLQFALAVALTRGDFSRSQQLRDQIAALGADLEEPGT